MRFIQWLLSAHVTSRKKRIEESKHRNKSKILTLKDLLYHAKTCNFFPVGNKKPASVSNPRMMTAYSTLQSVFYKLMISE